jgi:LysM repeat protein
MYDVSVNTIMWANDLKSKKLTVGDTLIILPVSGLQYKVQKGDTLKGLAKEYKVDVADIIDYNNLTEDSKLSVGDELIIPGAEVEVKAAIPVKVKSTSKTGSIPNNFNNSDSSKSVSGFLKPIPCRQSQGRHDKYAVDLACGKAGVSIQASISGKVIFAKKGWNGVRALQQWRPTATWSCPKYTDKYAKKQRTCRVRHTQCRAVSDTDVAQTIDAFHQRSRTARRRKKV